MISIDPRVHTPLPSTPVTGGPSFFGQMKNYNNNNSVEFGTNQPPYAYMQRQNSVSSLASSVSDFGGGYLRQQVVANAAVTGAGTFTVQFLSLLMEVYQRTCSDPTVTPFDTTNPPSGILNTVAKMAIQQSKIEGVEVGYERNSWLLTLVRHRLLEEVRKEGYLSRNNSNISLPPPPQFMEMVNATSFHSPNISTTQQQDYFSKQSCNQDHFGSLLGIPNPVNRGNSLMRSRSNSSQVLLARTRSNSNGLFALTPTNSESGTQNFNMGGLSLNTNLNHTNLLSRQRSNSTQTPVPASTMVSSPFSLNGDDPTMSEILRKKRESLIMKR